MRTSRQRNKPEGLSGFWTQRSGARRVRGREADTNQIYLHVAVGENGLGITSPLDGLQFEDHQLAT